MKNIYFLVKKELKIYFSSPIAYSVSFIFLLIVGYFFYSIVAYFTFYYLYEVRGQKGGVQKEQRLFALNSEAVDKLALENNYDYFEFIKKIKMEGK